MRMRTVPVVAGLVLALAVAGCGGSATPSPATPAPTSAPSASPAGDTTTLEVAIAGFAYSPAELSVGAGLQVTWTNKDSATHTVTLDDGSSDSGRMSQGSTFTLALPTAGSYAYHCAIHPAMTGVITVTP